VFNIDTSMAMNDFSRMILMGSIHEHTLPSGHSYRLQIPREDSVRTCFVVVPLVIFVSCCGTFCAFLCHISQKVFLCHVRALFVPSCGTCNLRLAN
jgi:hypothetical protein